MNDWGGGHSPEPVAASATATPAPPDAGAAPAVAAAAGDVGAGVAMDDEDGAAAAAPGPAPANRPIVIQRHKKAKGSTFSDFNLSVGCFGTDIFQKYTKWSQIGVHGLTI